MRALSPAEFVEHVQESARRALARERLRAVKVDTHDAASLKPRTRRRIFLAVARAGRAGAACAQKPPADRVRASGQVEATDVQVAAPVGGRAARARASPRAIASRPAISIATARHRRRRARAGARARRTRSGRRAAAAAARRRARRGHPPGRGAGRRRARPTSGAADAELAAAQADVERFEALLASNSGSRKQRDDAVTRRDVAEQRAQAARDRVRAAARERRAPARRRAPRRDRRRPRPRRRGRRADRDAGEGDRRRHRHRADRRHRDAKSSPTPASCSQPRAPIVVITDLDHAWANVYVDEPVVPRLRVGQPATVCHRRRRRRHSGHRHATSRRRPSSRRATCRPPRIARSWCTA